MLPCKQNGISFLFYWHLKCITYTTGVSLVSSKENIEITTNFASKQKNFSEQPNSEAATGSVRSSRSAEFCKIGVLENFANLTGKQLVYFLNKDRPQTYDFIKKGHWRRCFSVNFAKFLRTHLLHNTSERYCFSPLWKVLREVRINLK